MKSVDKEAKTVCDQLYSEASILTFNWLTYKKLFVADQQQIELLDRTGRSFFQAYHNTLLDEIFLSLNRLTDEPKPGKGARLSLGRLLFHLAAQVDVHVRDEIRTTIDKAEKACIPFRVHRNKKLAHLNLNTALNETLNPLPEITIKQVDEALKAIQESITFYSNAILDESYMFEPFMAVRDATSVLFYLEKGWKCLEEHHDRIVK